MKPDKEVLKPRHTILTRRFAVGFTVLAAD